LAQKNKLTVIIDGKEYKLVSDGSEEYIQKIALCVDNKMRDISSVDTNKRYSTAMLAMLTSLNIAEDYLKTKNQLDTTLEELIKMEDKLNTAQNNLDDAKHQLETSEMEASELKQQIIKLKSFIQAKGLKVE